MAQEYGAAQPIIDAVRKPYNAARRALGYIPDNAPGLRGKPVDTSGHDESVRQANRTFQQRAEAERAAAAAAPAPNTVKRVPKRTPARPAAKRR